MSAEHHQGHERHEQASHELEQARSEKLEELLQQTGERPDDAGERARKARELINKEKQPAPEPEPAPEAAAPRPVAAFLDHKLNYTDTMRSVQRRLSPASRTFSKVIHAPIVEKTSEALEKTIARPSVTAGATWTALIVGSVFYLTAYHYGYMLSGSELLFSFIVGALIGILVEGAWRAFRHR